MKGNEELEATRLLDVDDVATMLGVAPQTIYNWVYAKRIPHVKPSRSVLRFRREDIMEWVDRHAVADE